MKEVEYLIVGLGVAGSCFVKKLIENEHSFLVINQDFHRASTVAAGLYNPVVLKRFSLVWDAPNQLSKMKETFGFFENLLAKKYIEELPVYRIFNDEQEQKTWDKKAKSHPDLINFLSTDYQNLDQYRTIKQDFGSGEVLHTGRINLRELIPDLEEYLIKNNQLIKSIFDYNELQIENDFVIYQNIKAKQIIFCEGYHILENPFFKEMPIIGVKGEVLTVETSANLPKAVVKGKEFVFPLNENNYFVGATYDRDQLDYEETAQAKDELLSGISKFLSADFVVKDQKASIRPTVKDRRPIIGAHKTYRTVFCLNGMGTRGTMLAPDMAEQLYCLIEKNEAVNKEADVNRFY